MLDESLVKSKFAQFQEKYAGCNIDDYENYILSRTIEYFYNTDRRPIDELVNLIICYHKGEKPCALSGQAPGGKAVESKIGGYSDDPEQGTHSKEIEKTCRKNRVKRVLAAAAVGVFVQCGYRACRSCTKKEWLFSVLRKLRR